MSETPTNHEAEASPEVPVAAMEAVAGDGAAAAPQEAGAGTPPHPVAALVAGWLAEQPAHLGTALAEHGLDATALEGYIRSGISTADCEALRQVLVRAAAANPEDGALLARLTPALDPRERAWERLQRARVTSEVLTATVTEAIKGGVVVDLGVRGFVPASHIGLSVPRNLTQLVGRELRLRVLEVDRGKRTVILTNRQVLEEERAARRKTAIARLEVGEERSGTVRRITDIGAFVDVGGVDGLLHVSEIAWRRVDHPSDVLKVGQKVQVKVLRVDADAGRVSLSMRRLREDPWEEARNRYFTGNVVEGKVVRIVPQGAVVELEPDVEAFLPVGELAPRRVNSPEEVVQVDQTVEALIIDVQQRDRRIVLSLRKLETRRERQVVETVQRKQQQRAPERTTLGDLFGHLFSEFRSEPAAEAAPPASTAAPSAPASHGERSPAGEQPAPPAGGAEDVQAGGAEDVHDVGEGPETAPHAAPVVGLDVGPEGAETTDEGPEAESRAPVERETVTA